jgi:hypothetical protein
MSLWVFERDKSVISRHIRGVFADGELQRASVVAKNATTAADGKTYQVECCNLGAMISVEGNTRELEARGKRPSVMFARQAA